MGRTLWGFGFPICKTQRFEHLISHEPQLSIFDGVIPFLGGRIHKRTIAKRAVGMSSATDSKPKGCSPEFISWPTRLEPHAADGQIPGCYHKPEPAWIFQVLANDSETLSRPETKQWPKRKALLFGPPLPLKWSRATFSKGIGKVLRKKSGSQTVSLRHPTPRPGTLLNSGHDGRGRESEFGYRICHLTLFHSSCLLCYWLTVLETTWYSPTLCI